MITPGKWSTANEGNDILIGLKNDKWNPDCIGIVVAKTIGNSEMCKANAQAISVLPNLIEAAKDALDIVNSYSHIPALFRACQILHAALEKTEVKNGSGS